MNIRYILLQRQLAIALVMLLAVPYGLAATSPRPSSPAPNKAANSTRNISSTADAAGNSGAASNTSYPDAPAPSPDSSSGQSQQTTSGQSQQTTAGQGQQTTGSASQQTGSTHPVGTAAAPYLKPEGIAASRPAGAAIAPAKQRRVRSFAIRVALLVGAGVAIGTVVAASLGSPSRAN